MMVYKKRLIDHHTWIPGQEVKRARGQVASAFGDFRHRELATQTGRNYKLLPLCLHSVHRTVCVARRVSFSLIIALQTYLLTMYCVCNRKKLHRQGNVCNISSLFVIVRINPVMSRISIFNKQLEFVFADIGIEFIAHFKEPY